MKDKNYLLVRFGKKVRQERMKLHISQEKLAEMAKVHRTYIGMIERGEKNVTLLNIDKIAEALKMELFELMKF